MNAIRVGVEEALIYCVMEVRGIEPLLFKEEMLNDCDVISGIRTKPGKYGRFIEVCINDNWVKFAELPIDYKLIGVILDIVLRHICIRTTETSKVKYSIEP